MANILNEIQKLGADQSKLSGLLERELAAKVEEDVNDISRNLARMLPEQITSTASFWRDIAPDETAFQSFWGWITDQANQEIAVDGKHKVIFGRSLLQDGSDKLKAVLKSKWQEYIPVGSPGSPSVEDFEIPDADEKRIFSYHYKKSSDGVAKVTRPQVSHGANLISTHIILLLFLMLLTSYIAERQVPSRR